MGTLKSPAVASVPRGGGTPQDSPRPQDAGRALPLREKLRPRAPPLGDHATDCPALRALRVPTRLWRERCCHPRSPKMSKRSQVRLVTFGCPVLGL